MRHSCGGAALRWPNALGRHPEVHGCGAAKRGRERKLNRNEANRVRNEMKATGRSTPSNKKDSKEEMRRKLREKVLAA